MSTEDRELLVLLGRIAIALEDLVVLNAEAQGYVMWRDEEIGVKEE